MRSLIRIGSNKSANATCPLLAIDNSNGEGQVCVAVTMTCIFRTGINNHKDLHIFVQAVLIRILRRYSVNFSEQSHSPASSIFPQQSYIFLLVQVGFKAAA